MKYHEIKSTPLTPAPHQLLYYIIKRKDKPWYPLAKDAERRRENKGKAGQAAAGWPAVPCNNHKTYNKLLDNKTYSYMKLFFTKWYRTLLWNWHCRSTIPSISLLTLFQPGLPRQGLGCRFQLHPIQLGSFRWKDLRGGVGADTQSPGLAPGSGWGAWCITWGSHHCLGDEHANTWYRDWRQRKLHSEFCDKCGGYRFSFELHVFASAPQPCRAVGGQDWRNTCHVLLAFSQ